MYSYRLFPCKFKTTIIVYYWSCVDLFMSLNVVFVIESFRAILATEHFFSMEYFVVSQNRHSRKCCVTNIALDFHWMYFFIWSFSIVQVTYWISANLTFICSLMRTNYHRIWLWLSCVNQLYMFLNRHFWWKFLYAFGTFNITCSYSTARHMSFNHLQIHRKPTPVTLKSLSALEQFI